MPSWIPHAFKRPGVVLDVNVSVNDWVSLHVGPAMSWGLIQGVSPFLPGSFKLMELLPDVY